jgi:hypothetical protein
LPIAIKPAAEFCLAGKKRSFNFETAVTINITQKSAKRKA